MHRLVMASHKGGSGKTTTAVTLAGALAADGQRVLVVDADPQGAAAAALGISVRKPTLYEALMGDAPAREAIVGTSTDNISVLPSDLDLAGAEVELPRRPGWQGSLKTVLAPLGDGWDFAVIDTPPGLGVLSYCALAAASHALVVCPPEFLAFRSIPHLQETTARAGIRVLGIIPTQVTITSRHAREVSDALAEDYPDLTMPRIPRRVAFQDAALAGLPITAYRPKSDGARAAGELAKEVLKRVKTNAEKPRRGSVQTSRA